MNLQTHQNPLENELPMIFQEGVEDFAFYQRQSHQNYKSKAEKKKERILRLTKYVNDPEIKKLKKRQQRKAQQEKLNQLTSTMTPEEAKTYINGIRQHKEELKQKIRKAMGVGQVFMIDMVYEAKMNQKENRSLGKQVELIMQVIKHFDEPPSIHVCSFEGGIKSQMEKMGFQNWAVTTHKENVEELGQELGKKLIYLSPQAQLNIQSIQKDTAYILGGLVDRSVLKGASLRRAEQLGVEARKLPIAQFMKGRLCLNLDHVVKMMCKFRQCMNWKEAFEQAAPKRWKKEESEPQKKEFRPFEPKNLAEFANKEEEEENQKMTPSKKEEAKVEISQQNVPKL